MRGASEVKITVNARESVDTIPGIVTAILLTRGGSTVPDVSMRER